MKAGIPYIGVPAFLCHLVSGIREGFHPAEFRIVFEEKIYPYLLTCPVFHYF